MFKNRLSAGLQYRASIVGVLLIDLLSLSSTLILWIAIFTENVSISTYNISDTVLYFLFIPIIGSFTFVILSDEMGREIRQGFLTNYLLKPQNIVVDAFTRILAIKVNYIVVTLPIYLFITITVCIVLFHGLPITLFSIFMAFVLVIFGFLIHFFLDIAVTWLSFWIGDVWAFAHFKRVAFLMFGGMMYPLDFAPPSIRTIIDWLPFKYLYYIPNAYLLGKRHTDSLFLDIMIAIFWIVLFYFLNRLLWRIGLKKYEAYGG